MKVKFFIPLVCALLLISHPARAILTIEITHSADIGLPIAIVPFAWQSAGQAPENIAQIVQADLSRTGRFRVIPKTDFLSLPSIQTEIDFRNWRVIKAEALVTGSIVNLGANQYEISFRLHDVFKQRQLTSFRYMAKREQLRSIAHEISDVIHKELLGIPGSFNSRIAYITRQKEQRRGTRYKLQIADSDGHNPTTIVDSREPLMSPSWSPDGNKIAYVSFEAKRPVLYVQNMYDGKRERIANFAGINSAPAWSPDGRRLALVLSRAGNPEIYIFDFANRQFRRLTNNLVIDTEPAWSPDGRYIVYTSDSAGQPQIYRMAVNGNKIERLTFEGSYNARPSYSPDGKKLVLVSRSEGKYRIATLTLENRTLQVLTETSLDESPTFSANGQMILYATEVRNKGVLASISADGRASQLFRFRDGDVREPAWSAANRTAILR